VAIARHLILHLPHSSTVIPDDVRPEIVLSDVELDAELLTMTDHYTDELFTSPQASQRIVYPVSRLVLDPERFVDDTSEVMASRGMGLIYTRSSGGATLRERPSPAHRQTLIERFYEPHHRALTAAVDASLSDRGTCLIVDGHSFPAGPLPFELDQTSSRPDICLGTDRTHTPAWLAALARDLFRDAGWSVAFDQPFAGALVPITHFGVTPQVRSIMVELNRALYMDESSGQRLPCFDDVATRLASVLAHLAGAAEDRR
jgi:N-formylglutamate amidohydrolase